MKAICIQQAGKLDSLALLEIPAPEIADDEVLVCVKAIGVGVQDRWFMPKTAKFPYAIGIEAAGTIKKTGKAATHYQPGDRVMFTSSMQPKGGVWAEFAAVREEALIRIPDDLPFIQAAALPVAGGAALESIRMLGLKPGHTTFMAGASGAIGTLAIQLAKARGCRVAASASTKNHDYMRSLGAEKAVDYRDPDWMSQVKEWMPRGVDAALAIQPGTGVGCLHVVRDGGKVVTVSGDQLSAERGISVAQVLVSAATKQELAQLASEVAAGRIHIEIEQVYPLALGVKALEKTETRHARGKIVLSDTCLAGLHR